MPPDGYDQIKTAKETDLNGVVSVLINCLLFEQYIPDLANTINVGTKVSCVETVKCSKSLND